MSGFLDAGPILHCRGCCDHNGRGHGAAVPRLQPPVHSASPYTSLPSKSRANIFPRSCSTIYSNALDNPRGHRMLAGLCSTFKATNYGAQ